MKTLKDLKKEHKAAIKSTDTQISELRKLNPDSMGEEDIAEFRTTLENCLEKQRFHGEHLTAIAFLEEAEEKLAEITSFSDYLPFILDAVKPEILEIISLFYGAYIDSAQKIADDYGKKATDLEATYVGNLYTSLKEKQVPAGLAAKVVEIYVSALANGKTMKALQSILTADVVKNANPQKIMSNPLAAAMMNR